MTLFRYKKSLFVILLSIQHTFADSATRGLYFYSYEVNKENRTSLHIPLSDVHSIRDGFSMSFDLKIRNEKQNFGYIFHLTGNSNANIDLVISDLRAKEEKRISLIANDKVILQFTKNEIPDFKFDEWNKFKISFFKNSISITLNDTTKKYTGDIELTHISDMFFGLKKQKTLSFAPYPQIAYDNHSGRIFFMSDDKLITVGGYGFHKYNGVLIKYSFTNKKWEKISLSPTMSPRYLGSLGYLGKGKLLYFGGYGSEFGNQEEHPRNYYDLYSIDIHTDSVTKLWNIELPVHEEHYTNSNSMIIDEENDAFYVLTYSNNLYKTHIQARKFKISAPESSLVGDTIPYLFSDIKSYCHR